LVLLIQEADVILNDNSVKRTSFNIIKESDKLEKDFA
jgi:hypothetical protein